MHVLETNRQSVGRLLCAVPCRSCRARYFVHCLLGGALPVNLIWTGAPVVYNSIVPSAPAQRQPVNESLIDAIVAFDERGRVIEMALGVENCQRNNAVLTDAQLVADVTEAGV
jgi:hypothetical protein